MTHAMMVATFMWATTGAALAQQNAIAGRWGGTMRTASGPMGLMLDLKPDGSFMSFSPQVGIRVYGSYQFDGRTLHLNNERVDPPGSSMPPEENDTVQMNGNTMHLQNPVYGEVTMSRY